MAFLRSDAWRSDNCENKRSDNAIVNWKKTPCHLQILYRKSTNPSIAYLSCASPFLRLHPVKNSHPPFLTTHFRHLVLVDGIVRFVAIVAPPYSEACARPARPTRSLRAPHRHDFDARAFTRALYAGGQNHAGPANLLSCASRLSGLYASLRPSFGAATTMQQETHAAETPPPRTRPNSICP